MNEKICAICEEVIDETNEEAVTFKEKDFCKNCSRDFLDELLEIYLN